MYETSRIRIDFSIFPSVFLQQPCQSLGEVLAGCSIPQIWCENPTLPAGCWEEGGEKGGLFLQDGDLGPEASTQHSSGASLNQCPEQLNLG